MLFRVIAAVASLAFIAQGALAQQLTPAGVVTNIGIVTTDSANAAKDLSTINDRSDPQDIKDTATNLVNDFQGIIDGLTADVGAMGKTTPFVCDVTQPIVDALLTFVHVHQALLSTVIGQHSIFAQYGLTAPIAAILRSLEQIIDTFAFSMIALIPCATTDVTNDKNMLDESVGKAIDKFDEFCIPVPLYPKVQPICV